MESICNSEESLSRCLGDLRELWMANKYVKVRATTGKKRSLDQNGISHAWYAQVALELREGDELDAKCFCKLHFGVPILRAADADYRATYDAGIKHMSYAMKLKAMKIWPVTSLMDKEQLSTYLVAMQEHYLTRGVVLKFPELT